jgi:hypothetical protein
MSFVPGITPARRAFPSASSSRASTGVNALEAAARIARREAGARRKNRLRLAAGLAIIAAVSAAVFEMILWLAAHAPSVPGDSGSAAKPLGASRAAWMALAIMLIVTSLIAILFRKQSRSDVIRQFLETGQRAPAASDNVLASLALIIAMGGMLYGQFLIIDTIKAAALGFRLRKVDRDRVAVILGVLFSSPAGIDPRRLLRIGENPIALRQTLAYLMAYEWADLSPAGDYLNLLSPARRALKH